MEARLKHGTHVSRGYGTTSSICNGRDNVSKTDPHADRKLLSAYSSKSQRSTSFQQPSQFLTPTKQTIVNKESNYTSPTLSSAGKLQKRPDSLANPHSTTTRQNSSQGDVSIQRQQRKKPIQHHTKQKHVIETGTSRIVGTMPRDGVLSERLCQRNKAPVNYSLHPYIRPVAGRTTRLTGKVPKEQTMTPTIPLYSSFHPTSNRSSDEGRKQDKERKSLAWEVTFDEQAPLSYHSLQDQIQSQKSRLSLEETRRKMNTRSRNASDRLAQKTLARLEFQQDLLDKLTLELDDMLGDDEVVGDEAVGDVNVASCRQTRRHGAEIYTDGSHVNVDDGHHTHSDSGDHRGHDNHDDELYFHPQQDLFPVLIDEKDGDEDEDEDDNEDRDGDDDELLQVFKNFKVNRTLDSHQQQQQQQQQKLSSPSKHSKRGQPRKSTSSERDDDDDDDDNYERPRTIVIPTPPRKLKTVIPTSPRKLKTVYRSPLNTSRSQMVSRNKSTNGNNDDDVCLEEGTSTKAHDHSGQLKLSNSKCIHAADKAIVKRSPIWERYAPSKSRPYKTEAISNPFHLGSHAAPANTGITTSIDAGKGIHHINQKSPLRPDEKFSAMMTPRSTSMVTSTPISKSQRQHITSSYESELRPSSMSMSRSRSRSRSKAEYPLENEYQNETEYQNEYETEYQNEYGGIDKNKDRHDDDSSNHQSIATSQYEFDNEQVVNLFVTKDQLRKLSVFDRNQHQHQHQEDDDMGEKCDATYDDTTYDDSTNRPTNDDTTTSPSVPSNDTKPIDYVENDKDNTILRALERSYAILNRELPTSISQYLKSSSVTGPSRSDKWRETSSFSMNRNHDNNNNNTNSKSNGNGNGNGYSLEDETLSHVTSYVNNRTFKVKNWDEALPIVKLYSQHDSKDSPDSDPKHGQKHGQLEHETEYEREQRTTPPTKNKNPLQQRYFTDNELENLSFDQLLGLYS